MAAAMQQEQEGLMACPDEILSLIFNNLAITAPLRPVTVEYRPHDLHALCGTCKRLARVAQPLLFRHAVVPRVPRDFYSPRASPALTEHADIDEKTRKMINLLRTISENPQLGQEITSLTISRWCPTFRLNLHGQQFFESTDLALEHSRVFESLYSSALGALGLSQRRLLKVHRMIQSARDPEVVLFLLLAPNITELTIDLEGWSDYQFASAFSLTFRSRLLRNLSHGHAGLFNGFQAIKELKTHTNVAGDIPCPPVFVDEVLCLPSLVKYTGYGSLEDNSHHVGNNGFTCPISTSLKHASLRVLLRSIGGVRRLLQNTPNLETFGLSLEYNKEDADIMAQDFNMETAISRWLSASRSLAQHAATLQKLDLEIHKYGWGTDSLPSHIHLEGLNVLRRFTNLTHLRISESVLINFGVLFLTRAERIRQNLVSIAQDMGRIATLTPRPYEDFLPPNLQCLKIRGTSQASLQILKSFPHQQARFPRLKTVDIGHVDLRDRDWPCRKRRQTAYYDLYQRCKELRQHFEMTGTLRLKFKPSLFLYGMSIEQIEEAVELWENEMNAMNVFVDQSL